MDPLDALSATDLRPLSLLTDPVWVFDLAHEQIWWTNPAALELFAAPSLEVLQERHAKGRLTDGMRRRLQSYLAHFERGEVVDEPWTFYPDDSQPVRASCRFKPVRIVDEAGERLAMLIHGRLARGQGLRDEARLAEALRHTNEWVSLYALDGRGLLRNPAAEQALGLFVPGVDALRKSFLHRRDAEEGLAATAAGGVFRREVAIKGEPTRWADTEMRRVFDPGTGDLGLLVVQHEVTERRRAQERLERAREEADVLREEAERGHQAKSAFLGVMSHELRTPMNGVLGGVALLRGTALNDEQQELVELIAQSGHSMVALIDDVLDASRMEAGAVSIEPAVVVVEDWLEQTLGVLRVEARDKGLELALVRSTELPVAVRLDGRRLRQVLGNLVSNAIKFSERGTITIEARHEDGVLELSVADEGVGMNPREVESLFDAFVQADATKRRSREGVGLGLYIVRTLARAMGGDVRVLTRPGEGSTFHVHLLAPVAAAPTPAPRLARATLSLSVLVVDDNQLNRRVLCRLLRRWGCSVIEAADGNEALARAREHAVDLVLMDVWMPELDGVEATRLLKQQALVDGPIIATTADAGFASERSLFDSVLIKPFAPEVLHKALLERQREL